MRATTLQAPGSEKQEQEEVLQAAGQRFPSLGWGEDHGGSGIPLQLMKVHGEARSTCSPRRRCTLEQLVKNCSL